MRIYGFDPVWSKDARVLVLGSMPSVRSLEEGFYYGHARNCFWPMIAQILGEAAPSTIEEKKRLLFAHGIALWDVIASCERAGSLDSAIRLPVFSDVPGLLAQTPNVRRVLLNGQTAHHLFVRHMADAAAGREVVRLPSTSPAYTLPYAQKQARWAQWLADAGPSTTKTCNGEDER